MDSNLGAENAVSKQSGSKTLGKFSEAFLLDGPPDPPADFNLPSAQLRSFHLCITITGLLKSSYFQYWKGKKK